MCFRNLPIEFDAQGHARLKPGVADPYSYTQGGLLQIKDDRERFAELFEGCDSVRLSSPSASSRRLSGNR